MARTSRNGAPTASVDALDNLNLDDMFADEGDALFDGLDIDLGNMDDIAGSSGLDTVKKNEPLHPPAASAAPASAAVYDSLQESTSFKRKKSKRKVSSPAHFDDEDDEYEEPFKKKKKNTKTSSAKSKRGSTKTTGVAKKSAPSDHTMGAAAAVVEAAAVDAATAKVAISSTATTTSSSKSKSKTRTSVSMPPPLNRSSSSTVAAAGQFGGRLSKRSSMYTLLKGSKSKTPQRAPAPAPAPVPVEPPAPKEKEKLKSVISTSSPVTMAQIQATHPGLTNSPFCGLLPSNTLFYPFMPALPAEPSFKNRKIFAIIDRVHTAFIYHLSSAGETEAGALPATESQAIFQLMQEAYKDEKPESASFDKTLAIRSAVGVCRRTIIQSEKLRLAGDLLAVCALLKRQHDFLRQNTINMEQWCKSHFSAPDYASVYLPSINSEKRRVSETSQTITSVLSSFTTVEIKVRLICAGVNELKTGPIVAILPTQASTQSVVGANMAHKAKKRKLPVATESTKTLVLSPATAETQVTVKPPLSYPRMAPSRRRKIISGLVSRSAADLEAEIDQHSEEQLRILARQQNELKRHAENNKQEIIIDSFGMWEWLEKLGYFGEINDDIIRWRLDGLYFTESSRQCSSNVNTIDEMGYHLNFRLPESPLVENLQSLLVEEPDGEDDDTISLDFASSVDYDNSMSLSSFVNLSAFTTEERAFLHLQSAGLLEDFTHPSFCDLSSRSEIPYGKISSNTIEDGNEVKPLESNHKLPENELDEVIDGMIRDLNALNNLNKRRALNLEATIPTHLKQKNGPGAQAEDVALIVKCQQLLKKTKEARMKNGKAKAASKDELALPW